MEKQKKEIRLDGKWRVIRKFIDGDTVGKSMTIYEDYFVEFAPGDTLIETHGAEVTTTRYCIDPGARTIESNLPLGASRAPSPVSAAQFSTSYP